MLAQFYASQEASGKDTALRRLTRQISRAHQPAQRWRRARANRPRTSSPRLQAIARRRCATENERARRARASGDERRSNGCAHLLALSKDLDEQEDHLQRGAGQGRPAQPAAPGAAPADRGLERGARGRRGQGHGEPDAHQRSRRPPQRGAGAPGAGAAALPLRLLRPPARASAATARTSASSATASCSSPRCCSRPAQATLTPEGLAAMDQLACGHRRAGAPDPQGDRLGAAGRRPHRHPADRQSRSSPPTGSCRRARAISVVRYLISRGVVPQRPGRGRLRRVPAADDGHRRGEPAAEPPHRAEADEPVAGAQGVSTGGLARFCGPAVPPKRHKGGLKTFPSQCGTKQ